MDLSVEPSYMSDTQADEEPLAAVADTKPFDNNVVPSSNRRFSSEPSAEPVVLDPKSNSSSSSSSLKAVRYRECMRNHAATIGGHANDGCGEFMARGPDGTPDSLSCAACGCHRNFHRREVSYTSVDGAGSAVPSAPTQLLLHHQPHYPGRSGGVYHQLSAAPIKSAPPHLQRQLTMLSQNKAPQLGSKWPKQPHDDNDGNEEDDDDEDDHDDRSGGVRRDDNMEVDYDRTPERDEQLSAGLQHRMGPMGAPAQFGSIGPTMAAPVNIVSGGTMMRVGKRFRTKFTSEQKERMLAFAERLGWRLQRHDDVSLNQFCAEIGVTRNVFKVWMHNNKNLHRPRPMGMGTTSSGEFSSSPAAPQQMVAPPPHPSSAPPQSVGV
ncbi:hypothetical protein Drorol1_Dr00004798 [Drosera rotundifolia]